MDKKITISMISDVSQVSDSKQNLLQAINAYKVLGARFYNFNIDLDLKDTLTPADLEKKKKMLAELKAAKFMLYLAKKKFDVEYVPISTLYN